MSPAPNRASNGGRAQSRAPAPDVRLRILDGPAAGTEYALAGPVVRLGRGEENDIVLQDGNASRVHAEVVRDRSGRFVVRDLGSRNGIFVNKKKVPQAPLSGGDRILIGNTNVEFVNGAQPGRGAASSSSDSGTLRRWVVLGIVLGLAGFFVIGILGKNRNGHGGVGPVSGGTFSKDPDAVDLHSLLAPPTKSNGVGVGRNDLTKPPTIPPIPMGATTPQVPSGTVSDLVSNGDRAYGSGKLVDARAYYAQAARLDPTNERIANKLQKTETDIKRKIDQAFRAGQSYQNTGRYQEALDAYNEVVLLDPDPVSINNANAQELIAQVKKSLADQNTH